MRSHSKALFAVAALCAFFASASTALGVTFETRPQTDRITEANGQPLADPSGVAVDPSDNLWVSDTGTSDVSKFDSAGTFLAQNTGAPWGGSQYIYEVAYSEAAGLLYIADANFDDIWRLNPDATSAGASIKNATLIGAGCCYISVAVDNSGGANDGDLYVATSVPGNGPQLVRVDGTGAAQNFSASQTYISGAAITGTPEGNFAQVAPVGAGGVAVDSSGDVYVVDSGKNEVDRFDSSGEFVQSYKDASLSQPTAVAVHPTNGHVLVAGGTSIHEFDASGTHLLEFSSNDGVFGPKALAFDSAGKLYASNPGGDDVKAFGSLQTVTVADSTATGASGVVASKATLEGTIDPLGTPTSYRFQYRPEGASAWISSALQPAAAAESISATVTGLNPETPYEFRVLAFNTANEASFPSNIATFATPPPVPPDVTIDPILNPGPTTADVSGDVDPNESPVSAHLEYSSDGGASWLSTSPVDLGEGNSPVPFDEQLSDLEPSTEYQVRISATNGSTVVTSGVETFETDPAVPLVRVLPAAAITSNSAWIGGEVNPRNAPTTFYVEYSEDPGLVGSVSIPVSQEASAGFGKDFVVSSQLIEGLQPETDYYYRVVAKNGAGTETSPTESFTTFPITERVQGLPDGRVWEKVSPVFKAGANIQQKNSGGTGPVGALQSQAADDGESVAYGSEGKFAGADGGPPMSQYIARRGPNGWVTEGLNPTQIPMGDVLNSNYYFEFGRDLSWGALATSAPLNQGDPQQYAGYNMYMRDLDSKTHRLLSDPNEAAIWRYQGASANGNVTYIGSQKIGGSSTELTEFYRRIGAGPLEPFGPLPAGTENSFFPNAPAPSLTFGGKEYGADSESPGFNPVSTDGSRVFFGVPPTPTVFHRKVYTREGNETIEVSASERTSGPSMLFRTDKFLGASKDGSLAFFSSPDRLTDASNSPQLQSRHLYRWDRSAPEGERLTDLTTADPQTDTMGMTGISDDGTTLYFIARGDLTGDGDGPSLYMWREGVGVRFVAHADDPGLYAESLNGGGEPNNFRQARVSPDGRFLAFNSNSQLSSYDTDGTIQVYLYDNEMDRLLCVSCGTVTAKSENGSYLLASMQNRPNGGAGSTQNLKLSNNLAPDGSYLYFDSVDALVPQDTNGNTDVYKWDEGRLYLISSGTSDESSMLLDISLSGNDVFFTTKQRLVRSDRDNLADLYDARVDGVPEPDITPPCVADECQGTPSPPPAFETPASTSFRGAGNVVPKANSTKCAKGKVRRKGRCVKNKKKSIKRANKDRRAGR